MPFFKRNSGNVKNLPIYQLYLINETRKIFGFKKMLLFILGLPKVLWTRKNWDAYERMGKCSIKLDNEKEINFIHTNTRYVSEVIFDKCYFPNDDFEIKPNYVVVDLGANIGIFTLMAAQYANQGKVFALEPIDLYFNCLSENIKENSLNNIIPIKSAISKTSGEIKISGEMHNQVQICSCLSMNDFIQKYNIQKIDFLKIDVEGAEFPIFKDTSWLDKVNLIAMEVHPDFGNIEEIKFNLTNFGFKCFVNIDNHDIQYLFAKNTKYGN